MNISMASAIAAIISLVKLSRILPSLSLSWLHGAAALLVCWLAAGAAVAAAQLPRPETGEWAQTTLALLRYNRELCDGIAGQIRNRWRNDGANSENTIRDFVLKSSLSDLAAARAAGDIIDRFLPRAKDEAGQETGASLGRLFELETALCDAVALPTGPRDDFDLKITQLLERIDLEEAELGRWLVLNEEILEQALEPYLVPIQIAGIEAEGEYLDYLESIRPKPKLPTRQELMVAWHQHYSQKVAKVKDALRRFLIGRQNNDAAVVRESCREIASSVIPVLRNDALFKAPDPSVEEPLHRAFVELRVLATHCIAARFRETDKQIAQVQKYLGYAAQRLAPYSLQP